MSRNMRPWILSALALVAVVIFGFLSLYRVWFPEGIKIGVITALSGDQAAYGRSSKDGIDMAVDRANASGGVNGQRILGCYEDSQGQPKLAVTSFEKLVTIDKVRFVIGALASSDILAIAPIAQRKGIVLIAPSATAPAISMAGDFIFRTAASDMYEGTYMALFAQKELALRSAVILYINNDYGLGLRDAFAGKFKEMGGAVVAEMSFAEGEVDFRSLLSKVTALDFDCLYLIGYKELGRLLKQAHELGIGKQLLSSSMFEDPEILNLAGAVAEGTYFTSQSFDPNRGGEGLADFASSFDKKYGRPPDIFAALSYDATMILVQALRGAGTTDPEKVKHSLYGIRDYLGVTGRMSFDANGDVQKEIGIKIVKEGRFEWYRGKQLHEM